MKKYKIVFLTFGAMVALSLTGCYTQLIVKDNAHYEDNTTIIIYPPPLPPPLPDPIPPVIYPYYPPPPENHPVKYRPQEPPRPPANVKVRDPLRNSGGRNDNNKGKR